MPVQIPRLQPIAPQAPASAGLIEARVPDLTRGSKLVSDAALGVASQLVNYADRVETQTAKTETEKANQSYSKWYSEQLNGTPAQDGQPAVAGIRFQQGDPTEAYAKLEEDAEEKRTELLSGFSGRTERMMKAGLDRKAVALANTSSAMYGAQYSNYRTKTTNDSTALEQQEAVTNMIHVKPGDALTLQPFMDNLVNIQKLRVEHSLEFGLAETVETKPSAKEGGFTFTDDEGEEVHVKLSNIAKEDMLKDVSIATSGAIKNLIATDQVDKAQFMLKNFGNRIEPVEKAKLTSAFEVANTKMKALQIVDKMAGKSLDQKKATINKIPNLKVKQKTIELNNSRELHLTSMEKRSSTKSFNAAALMMQKNLRSSDANTSFAQFEENNTFNEFLVNVTDAKQRKTLREMVESPKGSSNEKVVSDLYERWRNSPVGFNGVPFPEFQLMMVGLNQRDKNHFTKMWERDHGGAETESKQRSRVRFLHKELTRKGLDSGLLRKDRSGLTKSSRKTLNRMLDKAMENFDDVPSTFSEGQSNDATNKMIQDEIADRSKRDRGGFFKGIKDIFEGAFGEKAKIPRPEKPVTPAAKDTYQNLPDVERAKVQSEYESKFGRPKSVEELEKFYIEQQKETR